MNRIIAASVAAAAIVTGVTASTANAASAADSAQSTPAKYVVRLRTCYADDYGNGEAVMRTTNRTLARQQWRRTTTYALAHRSGHDAISRVVLLRNGDTAADARIACRKP